MDPDKIGSQILLRNLWANVCKTVRPMLSDRCLSSLSVSLSVLSCLSVCLSVTLVYCSQTVGWIKIPLGREVGFGIGHIVLDGDQAPPHHGRGTTSYTVRPMSIVGQTAG